jgi:hypothetical protein
MHANKQPAHYKPGISRALTTYSSTINVIDIICNDRNSSVHQCKIYDILKEAKIVADSLQSRWFQCFSTVPDLDTNLLQSSSFWRMLRQYSCTVALRHKAHAVSFGVPGLQELKDNFILAVPCRH